MLVSYLSLLVAAFLAATILPLSSEALLLTLLAQGEPAVWLVLVASVGNTAGSWVNWYLGRYLLRFQNRKWFYFKPDEIDKAQQRFNRHGRWLLLFAWLPAIGDLFTLIAGVMRVPLRWFIPLVWLGKSARYAAVAGLFSWLV